MKTLLSISLLLASLFSVAQLKSVVYDFDGLDIGQDQLPDGDYSNYDLTYEIAANPLLPSDVIGDRVLKTNLSWALGKGEFGKGITRFIELDAAKDHFNFYLFNPSANNEGTVIEIVIKEDDNQNGTYESVSDDRWVKNIIRPKDPGWQLVSLPLNSFTDSNTGGNSIFDAGYSSAKGKVLTLGIIFKRPSPTSISDTYYLDMICFSEGLLPSGTLVTDLPPNDPSDQCRLGCVAHRTPLDSVPIEVEGMMSSLNQLKYVNIFMPYATSGTTANNLPAASIQSLINMGYVPMITWEMQYSAYPALDPVQPRLDKINNGYFDSYIDAFADKIKLFSDTVIIRLFHEFDGNWYSWCLSENNQDPNALVSAFRRIVNRFNARGASNVKWMWSPNSAPSPSTIYNWIIDAYPGDAFVDIVGTSIYNHPHAGVPPWRSFRSLLAESYYYLTTYFPLKPFFVAETASRERYIAEFPGSQSKAEWFCRANKDLQSYFGKVRALIFFNNVKEHDWRINSSFNSLDAIRNCFWEEPYYMEIIPGGTGMNVDPGFSCYPNPFTDRFTVVMKEQGKYKIKLYDISGKILASFTCEKELTIEQYLEAGTYLVEISEGVETRRVKMIKQ